MMKKLVVALLSLGLVGASAAQAATSYVPIIFRQTSGTRPFVKAMLNGKPLLMMVHANAALYLMTTHANAASVGIGDLAKDADYGITSPGHVSPLGLSKTVLKSLLVAGPTAHDVPLQVFEVPQDPPMDGMLGIDWLRDQKVIVDYDSGRLGIPDTVADARAEDAKLVAKGYVSHKMIWDPSVDRYKINGSFGGVPVTFTISTVSHNAVDKNLADHLGFDLGPVVDEEGGPQGALVPAYIVKRPLPATVDGQAVAAMQPWSYDIAGYASEKPHAVISVTFVLGADFMLANNAVIDFATETLLLPRLPEKAS
jgi:hypothetical protein